jgi:hypothetical protein
MTGITTYNVISYPDKHVVLDMRDSYTCSFTEFFPFCLKLYYFSSFKDFSTLTQA